MAQIPDPEFPSEEPREVTLYLQGGDVLRFPIREMDQDLLRRAISAGDNTLAVEYEDRMCIVPFRSVVYYEVCKDEYVPDDDEPVSVKFAGMEA